jgi:hypothetical protein
VTNAFFFFNMWLRLTNVKRTVCEGDDLSRGFDQGCSREKKKKMISLIADSLIHKFGNHLQI